MVRYDDEEVVKVKNISQILQSSAYILFYERSPVPIVEASLKTIVPELSSTNFWKISAKKPFNTPSADTVNSTHSFSIKAVEKHFNGPSRALLKGFELSEPFVPTHGNVFNTIPTWGHVSTNNEVFDRKLEVFKLKRSTREDMIYGAPKSEI